MHSRTTDVTGSAHAALGDPTVLPWVSPFVAGPLHDVAIMAQTAAVTFDGSDYVEVSFTETPQGAFAAVIGELRRGTRMPFVAAAVPPTPDNHLGRSHWTPH